MTEQRIEELADEIAIEVSRNEKGFGVESVENVEDGVKITFSWEQRPFYVEVSINPHVYKTDESVKDEIRRQLSAAGLRLTVRTEVRPQESLLWKG